MLLKGLAHPFQDESFGSLRVDLDQCDLAGIVFQVFIERDRPDLDLVGPIHRIEHAMITQVVAVEVEGESPALVREGRGLDPGILAPIGRDVAPSGTPDSEAPARRR